MNTDEKTASRSILLEGELTEKILAAAFKVRDALDAEILEKVPEDVLCISVFICGSKQPGELLK